MGISQNYFQGKVKLGYTKPWSILYACGVWASTFQQRHADEKKLMIFERKILRRIFRPKKNTENNEYER